MGSKNQTSANRAGRVGGLNLLGCLVVWHFGWPGKPPAALSANHKGNLAS